MQSVWVEERRGGGDGMSRVEVCGVVMPGQSVWCYVCSSVHMCTCAYVRLCDVPSSITSLSLLSCSSHVLESETLLVLRRLQSRLCV